MVQRLRSAAQRIAEEDDEDEGGGMNEMSRARNRQNSRSGVQDEPDPTGKNVVKENPGRFGAAGARSQMAWSARTSL